MPSKPPSRPLVGLSGWSYRQWAGRFYPTGLRPEDQLRFVAERFPTVEVNRSFYSFVSPAAYRRWHATVPNNFRFAVKGSRYITHRKQLNDVRTPLANFFASGVLELGDKLGPVLWQMAAGRRLDHARVETFLAMLPETVAAAVELAGERDGRVPEVALPSPSARRIRHVLEVRDPSAFVPETWELARRYGVAVACSDAATWPRTDVITTDFTYVRLHGPGRLYDSSYGTKELEVWAGRLEGWAEHGLEVFAYFDNDGGARAPHDARALMDLLE